jgi:hypothetical protein
LMDNRWIAFFSMLKEKSKDYTFGEYLPIGKDKFQIAYVLTDLNFNFTQTVTKDGINFKIGETNLSDICVRFDSTVFYETAIGDADLFEAIVQNRAKISGNSQFLTFISSKNLFFDLIRNNQLQQDVCQLLGRNG